MRIWAVFPRGAHLVFAAMPDVPEPPPPTGPGGWAPPVVSSGVPPEPAPEREVDRWSGRKVAGLPVGAWIGIGVIAIVGIVGGALLMGRGGDDPKLAIDTAVVTTTAPAVPPTGAPVTTVTPDVPSTTSIGSGSIPSTSVPGSTAGPAPTSPPTTVAIGGETPDQPLPAGDPVVSSFRYDDSFGSVWNGTVVGVVETPLYWGDDDGERCFVVLGTLTPERVNGLVSESWSTPYFTLFADGDEAELGNLPCDTESLAELGYRPLFDANATVGTEVAFYAEFSLPAAVGVPQAVAVGQGFSEWLFFDATLLAEPPPVRPGPVGALPVEPLAVAAGTPGPFRHTNDYTGDRWSGAVLGLVEVPVDESGGIGGRCYVVVGTLTADAVGSGLTTSPYGAPPIGLIAGGRLVDDYYGCSTEAVEAAGYEWFNDTEVTAGTSVAVYATLLVLEPPPVEVQAIVIGDPWGDGPVVAAPFVLGEFPAVTRAAGPPPTATPAPAGTPVAIVHAFEETTWDVVVHGHVVTGDCLVVYATATLTDGDPDATPPELFAIAGGRLLAEDFDCDAGAAESAGYVQQLEATGPAGSGLHVYAAFRPAPTLGPIQTVVVGRSLATEPAAVAPTELPTIPPTPQGG